MNPKTLYHRILPGVAAAALFALASSVYATPISSTTSAGQAIGTVIAGNSYTVSATGTIDLCSSCNAGGPLVFNPDGTVATTAQAPYGAFNSGPQDTDPTNNSHGVYGAGVNFAELYGSYSASPTSSDLFAIGDGATFTASETGTLYGVINDDNYGDNPSSPVFNATLASDAVSAAPEPGTWALMLGGVGAMGLMLRRRRRAGATFAA